MAQIGNRFTRIASSVCSPSIVPEIKLVWKRQLSCCHLKTLPPLPITLRKRCISAVTSLLLQGIPPCSLHALRSRAYSFAEHGYTKVRALNILRLFQSYSIFLTSTISADISKTTASREGKFQIWSSRKPCKNCSKPP